MTASALDPGWTRAAQLAMVGALDGRAVLDLDADPTSIRSTAGGFDVATAWLALHRAADPVGLLRAARRALRPAGRLFAMIPHPCTSTPVRRLQHDARGQLQGLCIDRYFDGNPLELWVRWFDEAGLAIRDLREPRPTAEAVRAQPELAAALRVPYFLMFELAPVTR